MKCEFQDCDIKLNFTEQIVGKCLDCSKVFCPLHRIPDRHLCSEIKSCIERKSREIKVKPKFVNYSRGGHIGV